jgi:hypothetical protein
VLASEAREFASSLCIVDLSIHCHRLDAIRQRLELFEIKTLEKLKSWLGGKDRCDNNLGQASSVDLGFMVEEFGDLGV